MPATYEELLAETAPARIETYEQYETLLSRLGDLVGKAKRRTSQETKLMNR